MIKKTILPILPTPFALHSVLKDIFLQTGYNARNTGTTQNVFTHKSIGSQNSEYILNYNISNIVENIHNLQLDILVELRPEAIGEGEVDDCKPFKGIFGSIITLTPSLSHPTPDADAQYEIVENNIRKQLTETFGGFIVGEEPSYITRQNDILFNKYINLTKNELAHSLTDNFQSRFQFVFRNSDKTIKSIIKDAHDMVDKNNLLCRNSIVQFLGSLKRKEVNITPFHIDFNDIVETDFIDANTLYHNLQNILPDGSNRLNDFPDTIKEYSVKDISILLSAVNYINSSNLKYHYSNEDIKLIETLQSDFDKYITNKYDLPLIEIEQNDKSFLISIYRDVLKKPMPESIFDILQNPCSADNLHKVDNFLHQSRRVVKGYLSESDKERFNKIKSFISDALIPLDSYREKIIKQAMEYKPQSLKNEF